jgi:hypothetical protein
LNELDGGGAIRPASTALIDREWLVTNGLGGYASGTVGGFMTRRYHGLLVAALPNPLGRTMMLNQLQARVHLPDGRLVTLEAQETSGGLNESGVELLEEFRVELGLPVWRYRLGQQLIERRVYFAHLQNTVYVRYRRLEGEGRVRLSLRPALSFRMHDAPVNHREPRAYRASFVEEHLEIVGSDSAPAPAPAAGGRAPGVRLPARALRAAAVPGGGGAGLRIERRAVVPGRLRDRAGGRAGRRCGLDRAVGDGDGHVAGAGARIRDRAPGPPGRPGLPERHDPSPASWPSPPTSSCSCRRAASPTPPGRGPGRGAALGNRRYHWFTDWGATR